MAASNPPDDSLAGMLLAHTKRELAQGNRRPLLNALGFCLDYDIPIPEWLAEAFSDALSAVDSFEARSWDDVFGKPHHGRKIAAKGRQKKLRMLVWHRVQTLSATRPIDQGLFEQVGKGLGISGAVAKRLYYDPYRIWGRVAQWLRPDWTRLPTEAEARVMMREIRKVEREAFCTPIPPGGAVEIDMRKIAEIYRKAPCNTPGSNSQKPRK